MHEHCTRVSDLTKAEMDVILNHIDNHKWYRMIQDDNEALKSFNDEFGPLLRDMYCRHACQDREECQLILKNKKISNFNLQSHK